MADLLITYFEWFVSQNVIRLIAGVFFLALFARIYFRFSGGAGLSVFLALSALAVGLFALYPFFQVLAILVILIIYPLTERHLTRRRHQYPGATATVESAGIKRGLTAPEAGVVLEKPVNLLLTVLVLGLLKKGVLKLMRPPRLVVGIAPAYRPASAALNPQERSAQRRLAAQRSGIVLHDYEEPLLELLGDDKRNELATLNIAVPVKSLIRHVADRTSGHDLVETRVYYRKLIDRARRDLRSALDSPEAEQVLEHHFEWLLLEDEFVSVIDAFGRGLQLSWLEDVEDQIGDPAVWLKGTMSDLAAAVPPGALQEKDSAGRSVSLGGMDRVTTAFLEAATGKSR